MASEILFIGPASGGGMSAVIDTFRALFPGARYVCSYRGGSKLRKAWDAARGLFQMRRILRKHPEIGIVHIHTASNASFRRKMLFARLAKLMGRKVVLHVHGGGFAEFLASDTPGIVADLNSLDAVICLSQNWADILTEAGVKRIFVLPNPVPQPNRVEVEPDGLVHIIFLGFLLREKGVYELLQAAADNRGRWHGKLMIHIAGTGPEASKMASFMNLNHILDICNMEGWVGLDLKDRLFSQADALVLPSYVEALPISILEAMSYGLPVIATPVGSVPTVVQDGENGILIPPADSKALAEAIDRLLDNPALRRQMGRRGEEMAKPFNPQGIGVQLQNIYRQL